MIPTFLAIYIGTTNDTNGNPRRGWYVSKLDGTGPTSWAEEGYRGTAALYSVTEAIEGPSGALISREKARAMFRETGRIEVTPAEYRSARKLPRFAVSP